MSSVTNPTTLELGGITPFSSLDYPGKLAAVFFFQGCPLRCSYCHNPDLQVFRPGNIAWSQALEFLEKRRGMLDAVVFSGGEPLAQAGLEQAMTEVRALGFKIGLHTAGTHTARLRRILPLCDWVGLDIKAPRVRYRHVSGRNVGRQAFTALEAVMYLGLEHEVRTTVDHTLLSSEDLLVLARELAMLGVQRWVLQTCRQEALEMPSTIGTELLDTLRKEVPEVICR